MKLFLYDEKHEQVNSYLDLGTLSEREVELLDQVTVWLEREGVLNRYKNLVIAESYKQTYEDGESQIQFELSV